MFGAVFVHFSLILFLCCMLSVQRFLTDVKLF